MRRCGLILAGGMSTRMKQDKAHLRFQDQDLLQRQYLLLVKLLGANNVWVSGQRMQYPHIPDLQPGLGPVEGLNSACQHFINQDLNPELLVIPVDMPFLSEDLLKRLCDSGQSAEAVKFSEFPLPVWFKDCHVVLSAMTCLKMSAEENPQYRFSFRQLYKRLHVAELTTEASEAFRNLNTPEEWHAAIS